MNLYFVKLTSLPPNSVITRGEIFLKPLENYGYQIEEINVEEIVEKSKEPDCLIMVWEWYYKDIISNIDILYRHHNEFNSKIILLSECPWLYEKELLQINNFLIEKNNKCFIKFFQNSEGVYDQYTMLESAELQSSEEWFKHDFIFYIVNNWLKQKKEKKIHNFLYLGGGRQDLFRKNFLYAANSVKDSLSLHIQQKSDLEQLYHRSKIIKEFINEKFNGQNFLGGFGNGIPPLDAYDKYKIEIAIETIQMQNYCHITEKTWRPLLCKMPTIILMGEGNYKKLLQMGYQIPFADFYAQYFAKIKIDEKIIFFLDFLSKNANDQEFYDEAKTSAEFNFEHFWNTRSKKSWKDIISQHKKIFGFSPLEELRDKFFHL
jgi:hypothetical protein